MQGFNKNKFEKTILKTALMSVKKKIKDIFNVGGKTTLKMYHK